MLPAIPYEQMLRIHKGLHTDVDIIEGRRVDRAFGPHKLYNSVDLADRDGRDFKFITQNMRKKTSPHTERVVKAHNVGERLNITWIIAIASGSAGGYYGRIESHLTRMFQDIFILDMITNTKMYTVHAIRR